VKLVVVAVGKIRQRPLREILDDYRDRIRHYARFEEIEVRETQALERTLPDGARIVALEVGGEALDSPSFARRLAGWTSQAKGVVAFVIGGADGIPPALSRRADSRLSLSKLTLPHRLARVVLFEQLYRAMTILRGEPYAREG
jgi:23S rRNA (pseudouridine1915-N3)-methyltransferase